MADVQIDWQPTASIDLLHARGSMLRTIREFFYQRSVLEVETPSLSHSPVSDVHLDNFSCRYEWGEQPETMYLQTSPEYAMKRLLAAGSGSIFQMSKAFRHEQGGLKHSPEFSLLEWYRVGFDHHQLMDEMDALLCLILSTQPAERVTYRDLFESYLGINPLTADIESLSTCAKVNGINLIGELDSVDAYLDLLLSHCIEPSLGVEQPLFVYDYPASQSALAKLDKTGQVAERFEVYVQGIELANGFHELQCPDEQLRRFNSDNQQRQALGLTERAPCPRLIAALRAGLPACSGVALGLDRLLMVLRNKANIEDVLSFSFSRS